MKNVILNLTNKIGEILFFREIKRLRNLNDALMKQLDKSYRFGDKKEKEEILKHMVMSDEEKEFCALNRINTIDYLWEKQKINFEETNGIKRNLF